MKTAVDLASGEGEFHEKMVATAMRILLLRHDEASLAELNVIPPERSSSASRALLAERRCS